MGTLAANSTNAELSDARGIRRRLTWLAGTAYPSESSNLTVCALRCSNAAERLCDCCMKLPKLGGKRSPEGDLSL
jgi:hypothetical protein